MKIQQYLFVLFFLLIFVFIVMAGIKYYYMGVPDSKGARRHPENIRRKRGDNIEISNSQGIPLIVYDPATAGSYLTIDRKTGTVDKVNIEHEGIF